VGIGILIPPSYSGALLVGGIIQKLFSDKKLFNTQEIQSIAAGLILGEGIVTLVVLLFKII
jgi:uncharacterized oligopeptide transporter (OPT) family protein